MKKVLICLLAAVLFITPALAEGVTLEGTVVATESAAVLAPSSGIVQGISVQAGDQVTAGEKIATLMETITYAEISGTVRVLGKVGESVETLTTRYGAVVYIVPDVLYTVSASTSNAYDQLANKIIELGETVYVRSSDDTRRTGVGTVTAISDSSYTVEVTSGNLAVSDNVYLYRSSDFVATTRIGKGTATYCYPVAYTGAGTGAVAQVLVADGAKVEAGTPLFSTVDAATAYNGGIRSAVSGTVGTVDVTPGTAVEAGALVATIYPAESIRVEILVDEIDLRSLAVEQEVTLTFANGVTAKGQVEAISGVQYVPETTGEDDDDTVYFPVYVAFQTDAPIACGMTAKVTLSDEE